MPLGATSLVHQSLDASSSYSHSGDHSEFGLVILAIRESASSSVNPPVMRDLYISWSRTADSSRADKPSNPCKFSMPKKLSEATDNKLAFATLAFQ